MLFDDRAERYDRWFETPIGRLVRKYEAALITGFLEPGPGEEILDAGGGTGVFTGDFLAAGAVVTGLDISRPMLAAAGSKLGGYPFAAVCGDVLALPFRDEAFDKAVSVTALEFIADARQAVDELFRVTRPGGLVVVATLNGRSPWAARRRAKTRQHVLENAFYRTPDELLALSPLKGFVKTAVHFRNDDAPEAAVLAERDGAARGRDTGAFVAVRWRKP